MAEWKQIEPNPAPVPKAHYLLAGENGRVRVESETCNVAPSWWLYVEHSKGMFVPRGIGDAAPLAAALDHAILQTTAFLAWLRAQQQN